MLYQGIAARAFERRFQLADHVQVTGAALEHGLLHVDLVREIPEAQKPRQIPIGAQGPQSGRSAEGRRVNVRQAKGEGRLQSGRPFLLRAIRPRLALVWLPAGPGLFGPGRDPDREGRPSPDDAVDLETAAVVRDDVLHQRKPQARPTLGAALSGIDPVEALRQTRQVLGRDAVPVIAHFRTGPDPLLRRTSISTRRHRRIPPPAWVHAIFDGVLDEVFGDPHEFVPIAGNEDPVLDARDQLHAVFAASGPSVSATWRTTADRSTGRARPDVPLLLDPRQRQQVVDQPRHAPGLLGHDVEEPGSRRSIVPRRALQRFDEAEQRRKRRAQFMAGIGDEIGAHALDAARLSQIVQRQRNPARPPGGSNGAAVTRERSARPARGRAM